MENNKDNSMTRLSVIVPIYNVENYLERCIKSILEFKNNCVEIILVNDGSTDSSGKICERYNNLPGISVINKENGGLSDARNAGLKQATGEYVWFVDSDDVANLDFQEFAKSVRSKPDILCANYMICQNGTCTLVEQSCLKPENEYTGPMALKLMLKANQYYVPVWRNIFRREYLMKNHLMFRKGIYHEDEQITPFLFLKADKVALLNKSIYTYYIRENSISSSIKWEKNIHDIFDVFYENAEFFSRNIKDEQLKKMLLNDIVRKMIYHLCKHQVPREYAKQYIQKKFLYTYAAGLKNKARVLVYLWAPQLYYTIYLWNEERKRNRGNRNGSMHYTSRI